MGQHRAELEFHIWRRGARRGGEEWRAVDCKRERRHFPIRPAVAQLESETWEGAFRSHRPEHRRRLGDRHRADSWWLSGISLRYRDAGLGAVWFIRRRCDDGSSGHPMDRSGGWIALFETPGHRYHYHSAHGPDRYHEPAPFPTTDDASVGAS